MSISFRIRPIVASSAMTFAMLAMLVEPAFAQAAGIETILQNVVDLLQGNIFRLFATIAVILIALRISSVSHSHVGRLSAAGMTAFFALFVLINGAMVMGLAPVVGVPMPLLSYGGSTMMTVMIGFGLILSTHVHRYVELPKGQGLF